MFEIDHTKKITGKTDWGLLLYIGDDVGKTGSLAELLPAEYEQLVVETHGYPG